MPCYFHNFLLNVLHGFWDLDIMVNDGLYFDYLRLVYDHWVSQINLLYDSVLYSLHYGFLYDLFDKLNNLMNDWNLDYSVHLARNLLDHLNDLSYYLLHFLYPFLDHYFLSDHFYLPNLYPNYLSLYNFLHNLGYLDYLLDRLDNRHWFFNYPVNYYMLHLNMIYNFLCISVFNFWHNFLNYPLNFNYFRYFHFPFNNLFHENWHLFNNLNDSLSWN